MTIASPSWTGAWRSAANSIDSPPARLISPAMPVDIQSEVAAGLTMASTSRSQMSPFHSSMRAIRTSSRRACARPITEPAAWYTRASRRDIPVTISWLIVPHAAASSSAVIRSLALRPDQHELVVERGPASPGTSVTSAMTASIATRPTSGTRTPRTSASARSERKRRQPSS